ncbi:Calcium/calmodulin-dependent protein kinase type I [Basidiobolus ranarum]|uniref:Calcium/calmodulin-dependent protein kinase type I n=1 Tax=Basidiobolus ranarum TaxID=34480 RepID=A0ABR2W2H2_9FUNG
MLHTTTTPPKVKLQPCKYRTGKTLGQGTFATVKEAHHIETGEKYAVKIISKKSMRENPAAIRNEIAILKRISQGHRNILSLVDYFETLDNVYLVTDLAIGGELFDRICEQGCYYEKDAAEITRTVTSAVGYLHDHGVIHRDLKPENLLFRTAEEESDLLIADFGISKITEEDSSPNSLTTMSGTVNYMAPEVMNGVGHGKPVDMWAIGVIAYILLCGYFPFTGSNENEELIAMLNGKYSFAPEEYWVDISEDAKDFIRRLLVVDPAQRMTASEAMEHPWLCETKQEVAREAAPLNISENIRKNFNARNTFRKAVDKVKMVNRFKSLSPSSSASSEDINLEIHVTVLDDQ